jgi:D-amino peptidase
MKVFILTDLEGVSGVNGRSGGIGNNIINEDDAKKRLMSEVNACVEGLAAGGADEIVVADGHGGSNSMCLDQLHPAADLLNIGGGMSPVSWIDGSYDAMVQIGAHAMHGVEDAYLFHTYNSHGVVEIRLDGRPIGEIGMGGYIAAYFGVPQILISGDEAACREGLDFFPDVATVATKKSIARYTTINFNPSKVEAQLREKSESALRRLAEFKVIAISGPHTLDLTVMCPNQIEGYMRMGIEKTGSSSVRFYSDDLIDLWAQRNLWAPGIYHKYFNISPCSA